MSRKFLDADHPFFAPAWRRWVTALFPLVWALGELWFGNDWLRRRVGSTATQFWAQAFQGDLRRSWKQGHVAAAFGRLRYDDNAPAPVRKASSARFASVEGVLRLSAQWHVAARGSFIDAPAGFNLVGDGRDPSPSLTEYLSRLSVGAGYRLGAP